MYEQSLIPSAKMWNALSTLSADKADVSMNDMPCFTAMQNNTLPRRPKQALNDHRTGIVDTSLCRDLARVGKVCLVANEHHNWILYESIQLRKPKVQPLKRACAGHVVDQDGANTAAIESVRTK